MDKQQIEQAITHWLSSVVIGLNLCPFAALPYRKQRVRILVEESTVPEDIINIVGREASTLLAEDITTVETSLLVFSHMLSDFDEYLFWLQVAQNTIKQLGYSKQLQIASFHPDYQFSDTRVDDRQNLTNCAPYPVFHLLRQESLNKGIEKHPQPESIPDNNIQTVLDLSEVEIKRLFPYKHITRD